MWTNQNSKQLHVADAKRGKTSASESRTHMVLVLLLIGWKRGMNFLSQPCSVFDAKPITFRHSNEKRSTQWTKKEINRKEKKQTENNTKTKTTKRVTLQTTNKGCAIPHPGKQIHDSYQRTTEALIIAKEKKQLSYEIDRNNSDAMSWEKTKAPGSARDSNSSASERLSLNGLQLEDE